MAFPPFDVWPLVAVALVPLLLCWRSMRVWRAAGCGFVFGVVFLAILLAGLTHTGYVGYVVLVAVAATSFAGVGALVAVFAERGISSPWLTAAVWVVIEGIRGQWPLGGLAWGEVGVSLHDFAPGRALASWGGVALVTFVLVAGNALVCDALIAWRSGARRSLAVACLGVATLIAIVTVADLGRFEARETARLRVALLQGYTRERGETPEERAAGAVTNAHFKLVRRLEPPVDLVVFPESGLDTDPEQDPALRSRIAALAERLGAVVLVNARHSDAMGRLLNANLAYGRGARLQGVYAKQHLVPFGEYVPFREYLGFIGALRQIPFDFTPGSEQPLFTTRGRPFGSVICYESAYASIVRDYVSDGAEMIVVTTSDRSYGRSGIAMAHVATAQMRAAETGRPVVQAGLTGISAVIDAGGAVRTRSELFERTVLTSRVSTTTGQTPFVRWGDWVQLASGMALVAAALYWAGGSRPRAGQAS